MTHIRTRIVNTSTEKIIPITGQKLAHNISVRSETFSFIIPQLSLKFYMSSIIVLALFELALFLNFASKTCTIFLYATNECCLHMRLSVFNKKLIQLWMNNLLSSFMECSNIFFMKKDMGKYCLKWIVSNSWMIDNPLRSPQIILSDPLRCRRRKIIIFIILNKTCNDDLWLILSRYVVSVPSYL